MDAYEPQLVAFAQREGLVAHVGRAQAVIATLPGELAPRDVEASVIVAGCLADDGRAQKLFETRYVAPVRPSLRALGLDQAAVDDVLQRVWLKLFVAEEGAPVVGYLGRGDLRAFVKVVATRLALSDKRTHKPQVSDEGLVEMAHGATPQGAYLQAATGHSMRQAVEEAAATLSPEERVLLRMSHVDGLTIDEIGATYGVHRATAARRVARARARLIEGVRDHLKRQLDLASGELDSVMRDVHSQLHVSISRILCG